MINTCRQERHSRPWKQHRSDIYDRPETFASNRCPIDVDPRATAQRDVNDICTNLTDGNVARNFRHWPHGLCWNHSYRYSKWQKFKMATCLFHLVHHKPSLWCCSVATRFQLCWGASDGPIWRMGRGVRWPLGWRRCQGCMQTAWSNWRKGQAEDENRCFWRHLDGFCAVQVRVRNWSSHSSHVTTNSSC